MKNANQKWNSYCEDFYRRAVKRGKRGGVAYLTAAKWGRTIPNFVEYVDLREKAENSAIACIQKMHPRARGAFFLRMSKNVKVARDAWLEKQEKIAAARFAENQRLAAISARLVATFPNGDYELFAGFTKGNQTKQFGFCLVKRELDFKDKRNSSPHFTELKSLKVGEYDVSIRLYYSPFKARFDRSGERETADFAHAQNFVNGIDLKALESVILEA